MTTRRTLEARTVADFGPALDGWDDPVAFGVGFDGAVFAVAARPPAQAPGETAAPERAPALPADYVVVRAHGRDLRVVEIPGLPVLVSFVQPFGEGCLLAGARCRRGADGPAANAVVVDRKGRAERAFTIGDGVQDVHVTARGDIWVSYFDEGVFRGPGEDRSDSEPSGESGLVRFDPHGVVRFTYDHAAAHTEPIYDAYATNVDEDGAAWVYFYSQFPIVRVTGSTYRSWKLGVTGARALAVRDERVLLFGDYVERSLGRLVVLEEDSARVEEEVIVRDDRGEPLDAIAYGQGPGLFFFKERRALLLSDW